jgi:transposase
VAQSDQALRQVLGDLDEQVGFPAALKELLHVLAVLWVPLRTALHACDARIDVYARHDERCGQLRALVGIGPITADGALATVGNAR